MLMYIQITRLMILELPRESITNSQISVFFCLSVFPWGNKLLISLPFKHMSSCIEIKSVFSDMDALHIDCHLVAQ